MGDEERKRIVAELRLAADRLEQRGKEAQRRSSDWALPATSSVGPAGKNVISRPTESAAFQTAFMLHAELDDRTKAAFAAAHDLVDVIGRIMYTASLHDAMKDCANPTCDAKATKAGRCETCYAYEHRTGRDRVIGDDGRAEYVQEAA